MDREERPAGGEGEALSLTEAGRDGVRLSPVDEEFAAQMAAAKEIMRADRMLRELARR